MYDNYYDQAYEEASRAIDNYVFLYYVIPILVLILICGAILLLWFLAISKTRKRQFQINQTALSYLKQTGFTSTSVFYFCDQSTIGKSNDYKKMLLVDSVNKKFALVNYTTGNVVIADFKEFLNYEIYENSAMVISGGAVGGLGLGFFGAQASGQCKDLKLIMRITKPDTPHVAYEVLPRTLFNLGMSKNSNAYRECIATLQEMVSFFEVIKNENEKDKSAV